MRRVLITGLNRKLEVLDERNGIACVEDVTERLDAALVVVVDRVRAAMAMWSSDLEPKRPQQRLDGRGSRRFDPRTLPQHPKRVAQ
jgi:hypothetical protein